MNPSNPLIVQSDRTLLLEVDHPLFIDARNAINGFAHLVKSPEYIHTYNITPLSLWNAASLGMKPVEVVEALEEFSKYPLPQNVIDETFEVMSRFGKLILKTENGQLLLHSTDPQMLTNLAKNPRVSPLLGEQLNESTFVVLAENRGAVKQALISVGYPAHDLAGYVDGDPYEVGIRKTTLSGKPFVVREYQKMAAESFVGKDPLSGGSGVLVLPCGAGKTIIGLISMSMLKRKTLILVTNITAVRQWKREILDKLDIAEEDIGEYSGEVKNIRPVTLATYQILTYRRKKTDPFIHYGIFNEENWGLVIYDEVHLLPAPIFQFTANLQARRRLGLTATLIREDGHEQDVFTLIGPKKYDIPWKDLEKQGWIANATCVEIRVDLNHNEKMEYLSLPAKKQIRLAYENPQKMGIIRKLLEKHRDDQVLIIGQYISQLNLISEEFNIPLITGTTPNDKRDEIYDKFRSGEFKQIVLSKVGNFAVDLPDANVAIQVSGSFGSRQEEAQRLGRILRPKSEGELAVFYSIVTRETRELDFAMKRQLFLAEQGYTYDIRYGVDEKDK